ncbi:MAG: PCRF domain-containing protein, partial [Candidatus Thorarchaeota archaeon]
MIKIENLEKEVVKPGFWNDNQNAQLINKEISNLKKWVEDFNNVEILYDGINDLLMIMEEEKNNDMDIDI